jgi:hypothetical protein
MKKSILLITFILMSSINLIAKDANNDCKDYAINAALAEAEYYNYTNFYDTFQAMLEYRSMCEEVGGNIGDPIFI